jgi:hypothetical protein
MSVSASYTATAATFLRAYGTAVVEEAQRQWDAKPITEFEPNRMDATIADRVRGLQPGDVRPALAFAPGRSTMLD